MSKSQSPERAQTFAACGMRQLVSCCLKGNQKPLEPQAPTSDSFLKNCAETEKKQTIKRSCGQMNRNRRGLTQTECRHFAACGMCQLVSCCQNASEPLEPLNTDFRWPLQNLHHALGSTSHSGPVRPSEITNHQAIRSTNEEEQQGSGSLLEPKDSFETSRVNAKCGSTALNPLPCCARRRWLRALNHAGWQSSLKAHGRCPWLLRGLGMTRSVMEHAKRCKTAGLLSASS